MGLHGHYRQHDEPRTVDRGFAPGGRQQLLRHGQIARRCDDAQPLPARCQFVSRRRLRRRNRQGHPSCDSARLFRFVVLGTRSGVGSLRLHDDVSSDGRTPLPRSCGAHRQISDESSEPARRQDSLLGLRCARHSESGARCLGRRSDGFGLHRTFDFRRRRNRRTLPAHGRTSTALALFAQISLESGPERQLHHYPFDGILRQQLRNRRSDFLCRLLFRRSHDALQASCRRTTHNRQHCSGHGLQRPGNMDRIARPHSPARADRPGRQ